MDTKKEQERDELHRAIWAIADDLRGSVDGWDFKSYVLGFMFYRYISENLTNYINKGEHAAGNADFDYTVLSDEEAEFAREDLVNEKGFFIKPSELFCNIRKKAPNDDNLNETLEKVFRHIEESAQGADSEDDFAGLFDDIDVNSNKLGGTVIKRNERLVKIINGVGDLQLGDYQDNTIDAFGDAYEFLMGMYASNAGKSGGEYFTPQEVSELLTRITVAGKTEINKVYDPACGSGSLLLKAAKVLGKDAVRQGFYGQEINITTYNLCRINMFLHDIDYGKLILLTKIRLLIHNIGMMSLLKLSCLIRLIPLSGRVMITLSLSMTLVFLLPVCLHQSQRLTSLLLCTRFLGLQLTVLPLSFVFPALCTVAVQKRKSENILLITTLLMQLFNFPIIFFTALQ